MTMLLKKFLELEPGEYEVKISATGKGAVELAQSEQPDLFIVDYHLRDMKGLELIAQLRQNPLFSNTPIIMASGIDMKEEALAAGANLFLNKPFEPSELPKIFAQLIEC
jgi:CheY-like chemotaxis protein